MNRLILFLIFILLFSACEDSGKFEEPQPSAKNDLNKIPKKLRATYFSTSGNTFLTINETRIIEWMNFEIRTLIDSLDIEIDSTKITEQTSNTIHLIESTHNLSFKFLPNDSVIVNYSYQDTLFKISNQHLLRRFKGHYFLNYKRAENNWVVRRLTLDKNELSFSKIRIPEDITELKEITNVKEIKTDSREIVEYKLKPTRKELKQLMKHNFSETKTYKKIE